MNKQQVIRHGAYIAATAEELAAVTLARRWAAAINQRVLFGHRGDADLAADSLVLRGWARSEPLTIAREDITGLKREFTRLTAGFWAEAAPNGVLRSSSREFPARISICSSSTAPSWRSPRTSNGTWPFFRGAKCLDAHSCTAAAA